MGFSTAAEPTSQPVVKLTSSCYQFGRVMAQVKNERPQTPKDGNISKIMTLATPLLRKVVIAPALFKRIYLLPPLMCKMCDV